ncbi:MBL fold metallo-hydrolase [Sneathiella sp. P13V-1]|uniref:MBL fold metallo-hydrolase n=1 Tax=Sneathiella sp. P13V-1 TaxID=2697366 RepID=UPI00187B20DD|nr:MBL fold metallo-hydrolase [Sneathiella sp. P13V-1]MBE7636048.1 MBL fold metallo-hydrolase [Sneathiella sp. P13V-1]
MSNTGSKNSGAGKSKGRFQNLPNPDIKKPSRKTYVSFVMRMMKYSREIVDIPEGHIIPQDKAANDVKSRLEDGADFITWLGQASFLIRMNGRTFLTDPYLSSHASPSRIAGPKRFVEPGLRIEDLPKIDYLVLSHNHYDHLDSRTLKKLAGKTEMMAIVPLGLGRYMEKRGFHHVQEMDWWDSLQAGDVTLRALPSQHWSKRTLFDRNKSLWASFAFEGKNNKVFFTGDTGYGPLFKDIGEDFGPFDYTLVGIGAYEPREIMKAHHTNPEEAVQIGLDVKSRILVGMHWGTVRLTDEPLFEPPGRFLQAAKNAGYDAENTWVMSIGESRSL